MDDAQIKLLIRQRRMELGLTQGQLASALDIDERTYKRIETSKNGTRLIYSRLPAIARVLGISADELLGMKGPVADESYLRAMREEWTSTVLKDERAEYQDEIAGLNRQLDERDATVKTLQQDIARLNRCLDDKDQIIGWLRERLAGMEGAETTEDESSRK